MLQALDLFGVFVFALSGALAADRARMDVFGFVVIALLPAIGGGTVRDIVLGVPVFWLQDPLYLWLVLAAALMTFLAANRVHRVQRLLVWADAVGLSVFSATGAAKAAAVVDSATVIIAMGVVTAVLGGVVRDVVCNEVPLVLRQEVYATAALAGAAGYVLLAESGQAGAALWAGAAICFAVRAAAILRGWSLPRRGPDKPTYEDGDGEGQ